MGKLALSKQRIFGKYKLFGLVCCLFITLVACTGISPALPSSLAVPSHPAAATPPIIAPQITLTATIPATIAPGNSPTAIPASTTAVPSATALLLPTAATTPVAAMSGAQVSLPLSITTFTASPQVINPGESITLSWQTTGGDLSLYRLDVLGRLILPAYPLSNNGAMSFPTDSTVQNRVAFELVVVGPKTAGATPPSVSAQVAVDVRCQFAWFFAGSPQDCPAAPATSGAATAQQFERGMMIRLDWRDGIYVLYGDGQSPAWEYRSLALATGQPGTEATASPPAERFPPAAGMSLIWRGAGPALNRPGDRLGWGTAAEQQFTGAIQCNAAPKYNTCYLQGPDNGIIILKPEASGWSKWATPTPPAR